MEVFHLTSKFTGNYLAERTEQVMGRFRAAPLPITVMIVGLPTVILSWQANWTTLFTPDSEFYLSLQAFGNEVTLRSLEPAYFWTRVAAIVPFRVGDQTVGNQAFQHIFRLCSIYAAIGIIAMMLERRDVRRVPAVLTGAIVASSTVFLAWIGDPYTTGSALLLSLACSCLAVFAVSGSSNDRTNSHLSGSLAALVAGLLTATLVFVNPFIAGVQLLVTGQILIALAWQRRTIRGTCHTLKWTRLLFAAAVGICLGLVIWLAVAEKLFPQLPWFATVEYWTSNVNRRSSVWMTPGFSWLSSEYVVIGAALLATASIAVAGVNRSVKTQLPVLAIGMAPFSSYFILYVVRPSNIFEASFYNAFLLPPALLAFLTVCVIAPSQAVSDHNGAANDSADGAFARPRAVVSVAAPATILLVAILGLFLIAGRVSGVLPPQLVLPVLAAGAAATVASFAGLRWLWEGEKREAEHPGKKYLIALAVGSCVTVMFAVAAGQLAPNLRPLSGQGWVNQRQEYSSAYVENPRVRAQVERNLEVQKWLLSRTSGSDKVVPYPRSGDPSVLSTAAMQLWGVNAVGELERTKSRTVLNIASPNTTVVAVYGFVEEGEFGVLTSSVGLLSRSACKVFSKGDGLRALRVCVYRVR